MTQDTNESKPSFGLSFVRAWRSHTPGSTTLAAFFVAAPIAIWHKHLPLIPEQAFFVSGGIVVSAIAAEFMLLHVRLVQAAREMHGLHRYAQTIRNYAVANIEPLHESIANLKAVDVPQPEEAATDEAEKPLDTKERSTLLKLVIGMAIDSYGFDPKGGRSGTPKQIADDLAKHGISVSDDTVRKYLKQAADTVLPANPRQS